jgi:hypothetical protein
VGLQAELKGELEASLEKVNPLSLRNLPNIQASYNETYRNCDGITTFKAATQAQDFKP